MQSVFVTGTDTGVGKTVVAAALLARARDNGVDAVPMKPVQTGCDRSGEDLVAPDLEFCLRAAGIKIPANEIDKHCPYRFEPACSPHLAAARAGTFVSLLRIRSSFDALSQRHDAVIVEGAGGVLVPVDGKHTMLDLMEVLALPVILVARPGLGTLNHTLLSLQTLRGAGLKVQGVVIVDTDATPWSEIEQDNAVAIAKMGDVDILARLPYVEGLDSGSFPDSLKKVFSI